MGCILADKYMFRVCEQIRDTHGCYRFNCGFCRKFGGCFIRPTRSVAEGKKNFWRARRVIWPALNQSRR
jgi:hypothetical protein